jgi:hypothetical protein
MLSRRTILQAAGAGAAVGLLGGAAGAGATGSAARADAVAGALAASDLVYLSPLRASGAESRCQAEVWFVAEGADILVVTAAGSWRARALRAGLPRARIWIGDVGVWTRAEGRHRSLPQVDAVGSQVDGAAEQTRVLGLFGAKYPVSWILWGPRFRRGLEDGSRVMLRYRANLA